MTQIFKHYPTRDSALDVGYRAYKLVETNFRKWDAASSLSEEKLRQGLLGMESSLTENSSVDDLFTELLLKQGFSLSEALEDIEIADLQLKAVRHESQEVTSPAVLAYLDQYTPPTLEQLRAITEAKPSRLILLEDSFQGNDELKTNLVQMCKTNKIELWTA